MSNVYFDLINRLEKEHFLSKDEFIKLISCKDNSVYDYAFEKARNIRDIIYGREVFVRGLIEYTNYCKNNCYYCGIRRDNSEIERYRLTDEEILECCMIGYNLGIRTFVLQGGEDAYFYDERMVELIKKICSLYPDCVVTLSIGEKSYESYKKLYDAGARRYLLRHETANECHYGKLHPSELNFKNRIRCLEDLKKIGYSVGCGFMVGSPFQEIECIADDFCFMENFKPHMVGIGPFIPHKDTPFRLMPAGDCKFTVYLLALVRIMLPNVLLPATTALGTICEEGREMALNAGANVIMPNLSPMEVRNKYMLYNNKKNTKDEAAEQYNLIKDNFSKMGYTLAISKGDYKA